ncbi:DUF1330 domain-containing protein [Samsonia erythrinae]|uniref:Uncharacterized protein (DUF1330 family) n=1 Tax=Samsonia erythrinae TaxID=160434 RepID=A0A4R3VUR4_9GAMM|nr:DUF1330 domain-containing protein [Samsonia erythrinae]TCV08982.1 uncharacterized protein (DUF1330 family) [Samsonia erythrinae]
MAAYWIAHVTIHDHEQYQRYMDLAPAAFKQFNARFLARGGQSESPEGPVYDKHVVIEFDDYEHALACYHSDAYQNARRERQHIAEAMITIVDGQR